MLDHKVKVMVVDDAVLMRVVIFNLLCTDPGIETVGAAGNGKEALELLNKKKPDIILLDIEMPVMDGFEFLRHVRLKSNAKIIVLSSVTPGGSTKATQAIRLGASAVISKPSGAVSLDLAQKSGSYVLSTIHRIAN